MYIGKIIQDKGTGQLWKVTSVSMHCEESIQHQCRYFIKVVLELVHLGPTVWDTKILRNAYRVHNKEAEEKFFKKLFEVPFPKPGAFADTQPETPD